MREAGYGILYVYVAESVQEGWLKDVPFDQLEWYEKLVLVDPDRSRGFVEETGANGKFSMVAVGHGFIVFSAQSAHEFRQQMQLTRPWMEAGIREFVKSGKLDPKTDKSPLSRDA